MKYYVAGDHYASDLAKKVSEYLFDKGLDVKNIGSKSEDEQLTLQSMIPKLCDRVKSEEGSQGILICGTGAGVEIGANRFSGIRASLCTIPKQAEYAKVYDKANVLCLSSWLTEDPEEILDAWLNSEYDGDQDRLEMIKEFDSW